MWLDESVKRRTIWTACDHFIQVLLVLVFFQGYVDTSVNVVEELVLV